MTMEEGTCTSLYCPICSNLPERLMPNFIVKEQSMEGQVIIDSESPDKGKKYDDGKPMMHLLSPIALRKISDVLTFGAKKYGAENWREGISWTRVIGAALRHLFAFIGGEDKDPETGLSHLSHLGCCVMFLLEYEETHKEKDDRYKSKPVEQV